MKGGDEWLPRYLRRLDFTALDAPMRLANMIKAELDGPAGSEPLWGHSTKRIESGTIVSLTTDRAHLGDIMDMFRAQWVAVNVAAFSGAALDQRESQDRCLTWFPVEEKAMIDAAYAMGAVEAKLDDLMRTRRDAIELTRAYRDQISLQMVQIRQHAGNMSVFAMMPERLRGPPSPGSEALPQMIEEMQRVPNMVEANRRLLQVSLELIQEGNALAHELEAAVAAGQNLLEDGERLEHHRQQLGLGDENAQVEDRVQHDEDEEAV